MNCGLSIEKLSTGYQKQSVITDLTVPQIPRSKITVLLGPNGSGKSTLLRSLAGLNPAQGKLYLGDADLLSLPFSRRAELVVYMPQALPTGIHLSVLESIIVARRVSSFHGSSSPDDEIMELLEQLGISHLAMRYLDELSGGQKQLVGLAQSLIRRPSLLLLDEPLSALDLNYQFHVMRLIRRETRKRNIVTIVVVHDINIALRHGEHLLMLQNGNLVTNGLPAKVITTDILSKVYGVRARIEQCSKGIPQVLIDDLVDQI